VWGIQQRSLASSDTPRHKQLTTGVIACFESVTRKKRGFYHSVNFEDDGRVPSFILAEPACASYPIAPSRFLISLSHRTLPSHAMLWPVFGTAIDNFKYAPAIKICY
jgi:hypothetical protein